MAAAQFSEFTVAGSATYDYRDPVHWILSHLRRSVAHATGFLLGTIGSVALSAIIPSMIGLAFDVVRDDQRTQPWSLTRICVALLFIVVCRLILSGIARLCMEVLAKRFSRDARDELYLSLLGKSQTFHNRLRTGDIMARGTSDVRQLNVMLSPGIDLIVNSMAQGVIPLFFIAFIDWRLLLTPILFWIAFIISLRHFVRKIRPVSAEMRDRFGELNAGLNEVIRGIDVVKATAQENVERAKFARRTAAYREAFVRQGRTEARYIPTLLLSVATAGALLHGLTLLSNNDITLGQLVAYLGLMGMVGFPTFISLYSFALVQTGLASAQRILEIVCGTTELDHNPGGHKGRLRGSIDFEQVSFRYERHTPTLTGLTFHVEAGETVAIVGETGSGKSTVAKLVNRIYDASSGCVKVDGVDVRDWDLDSLRSQISTIDQDVIILSRSVSDNISFGVGEATADAIRSAARDAAADTFISELKDGYETIVGERGVTLSGGERQRLAIARALITDPAVLILDDSTSAIDSATEDAIQQAIHKVSERRTTLIITHRLSQIRWADKVLVLKNGRAVDIGSHHELVSRCLLYRRMFMPDTPAH